MLLTSAVVKVCGRRPRARRHTVMGPASANLHTSGHSITTHSANRRRQRKGEGHSHQLPAFFAGMLAALIRAASQKSQLL
jgi:hypothetical protein